MPKKNFFQLLSYKDVLISLSYVILNSISLWFGLLVGQTKHSPLPKKYIIFWCTVKIYTQRDIWEQETGISFLVLLFYWWLRIAQWWRFFFPTDWKYVIAVRVENPSLQANYNFMQTICSPWKVDLMPAAPTVVYDGHYVKSRCEKLCFGLPRQHHISKNKHRKWKPSLNSLIFNQTRHYGLWRCSNAPSRAFNTCLYFRSGRPVNKSRPQFTKTWKMVCLGSKGNFISNDICIHQMLSTPLHW